MQPLINDDPMNLDLQRQQAFFFLRGGMTEKARAAFKSLVAADPNGNTVQGPVHAVDTTNCIIVSDGEGLVATLGVDDLVIIQSGGATLVARKDQLDKLKGLVEGLDKAGHGGLL